VPSNNRLWRFGEAKRRICWRHSKPCFSEPGATGLRAAANILPQWKELEYDHPYPGTQEKNPRLPLDQRINAEHALLEAADIPAETRERLDTVEEAKLITRIIIITKGEHHADPNHY
jgi:hypothetical protein